MSESSSDYSIVQRDEAQREFVGGMQSLDKAIELLCEAEISGTTPAETIRSIAQSLGLPINQAHKHFTAVKKFWEGEKARLCKEIEVRVATINSVKTTVSEKQMKVERINQQLWGLNEEIYDSEQNVVQAIDALRCAGQTLYQAEEKLKRKKKQQKTVKTWGFVSLVFAPDLGAGMWIAAHTALENDVKSAKAGVSRAENNVEYCENRVRAKKIKKENVCQQLRDEESQKQMTEQELRSQEQQLQNLQNAQKRSVQLSDKLMKTCHVMTEIWGKSRVLKNEARLVYSLEPLLTPLKEIVDMFTPEEQRKIKESTFLLSREVDFSGISLKLKAVAEASDGGSFQAILDDYS